jgi:selenocysteine-specific elongation factor
MKQIVMGTAGHIDHGKTALIKALTGIDCDRLKEEKERGITIDLGFAYLPLANDIVLGIVDVPGHERFVRNMLAGAAGIDFVLLVIAADEGIMPQTREHLAICQLLRIKDGLVALTKKDLVEEDWLELMTEEVRDFLQDTFLDQSPIIPVSSRSGEGIEELREAIAHTASQVPARVSEGTFRLPIDRVFTIKGFGTVVTGTTHTGSIGVDQPVTIYPRGLTARVRGIQVHGKQVTTAIAGQRTAINLQGVSKEEISRGDVISIAGGLYPSYLFNAFLQILPDAPRPLKDRTRIRFHHGTNEIIGRVHLVDTDELLPGQGTYVQFHLEKPLVALPKDRYVIRSYSPIQTIGGGELIEVAPKRIRKGKPGIIEHFILMDKGKDIEIVEHQLLQAGSNGLRLKELIPKTHLPLTRLQEIYQALENNGQAIRLPGEGDWLLHMQVYQELIDHMLEQLKNFHTKFPLKGGISKEELKSRSLITEDKIFLKLLQELERKGKIVVEGEKVRSAQHSVRLEGKLEKLKYNIEREYSAGGFQPPDVEKVCEKLSLRNSDERQLINVLLEEGRLVRVKGDLLYHQDSLKTIEQKLKEFLKKHKTISPGEFKELFQLSRKYAIPLLEYFDSQKLTMRMGDKRILRRES